MRGMVRRVHRSVSIPAAIAIGVFFVMWHARTFRLEVDGASVAWIALVAFAVMWPEEERSRQCASGLLLGAVVGVIAFYGSVVLLPLTPFGVGLGLGLSVLVLVALAQAAYHLLSMHAAVLGFGIGAGLARFAGLRPTSGFGDVFEVWMACSLAILLGVFGARALQASLTLFERSAPPEDEEEVVSSMEDDPTVTLPKLRVVDGRGGRRSAS